MRAAVRAAVATTLVERLLASGRPSGLTSHGRWTRVNYRGRPVRLDGGVAVAAGVMAGMADVRASRTVRGDRAHAVNAVKLADRSSVRAIGLALAAATAGGYDDLFAPGRESAGDKGLAGHMAALRAGRVSGGVVKVVAIGAAAWWAVGPSSRGRFDRGVRTVAVAGSANLLNLLDLRPGRAGKVAVVAAAALTPGFRAPLAPAVLGATVAALPRDLGEQTMLGDTGANTLGAVLGLRAASASTGLAVGTALLTTAAAVVSERVSFSAVIDRTPWLRRLDQLGRASPPAA